MAAEWVITAAHCVVLSKNPGHQSYKACVEKIPKEPHQETQCRNLGGICKRSCNCEPEGKIVPGGFPSQMDTECCVPNIKKVGIIIKISLLLLLNISLEILS